MDNETFTTNEFIALHKALDYLMRHQETANAKKRQ